MLAEVEAESIEYLFSDIPESHLIEPKNFEGLEELNAVNLLKNILGVNVSILKYRSFLGSGVWCHYVPAVVDEIAGREEFYTSYTPYQPEISQGALQALFEYQSLICELTGMDVANCSMYDWATALAEAALMSVRVTGKKKIVIPRAMHPKRLLVLRSYLRPLDAKIRVFGYSEDDGQINISELEEIAHDAAMVYVEQPSFFGVIETMLESASDIAHKAGALYVVGVNPISLAVIKPPGEYGADIVVGEGQPLGSYPNYGGPLIGIFACKGDKKLIWQMPGRIIGATYEVDGEIRGYVMTLQTREQHIRKERATSNICTNTALNAIRAAIYIALLGSEGLLQVALKCMENRRYLMKRISEIEHYEIPFHQSPHFNEFVVRCKSLEISEVNKRLLKYGIIGGLDISNYFRELGNCMIVATTEIHTRDDLDHFVEALDEVVKNED